VIGAYSSSYVKSDAISLHSGRVKASRE
jgi:hypothetical protein